MENLFFLHNAHCEDQGLGRAGVEAAQGLLSGLTCGSQTGLAHVSVTGAQYIQNPVTIMNSRVYTRLH